MKFINLKPAVLLRIPYSRDFAALSLLLRTSHFLPRTYLQPTGQGTGLSLSYDLVKAHGGVPIAIGMRVDTKEGDGSKFIISLPL